MRKFLWFCMPAAMLFALLPGTAAAKTEAGPSCGATITKSVTLKANLNCSGGGMNGLIVGRNGIVINLNGHTITGAGGANHYSGIVNNSHSNVTVENGTIKNFYWGYFSDNAHHETVTKVTFSLDGSRSYYGLYAEYGGANTYSHNNVSNAYYGFETYGEAGDTFTSNTLTGNKYAVYEEYSHQQTWMSNKFSYSGSQGYYEDYGSPILIRNVSNHDGGDGFYLDCDEYGFVVMKNNTATNDAGSGVYSYYCYSDSHQTSTFTGNMMSHNTSYGLYSYYDWKATVSGNTADSNASDGFYFYEGSGLTITKNTSDKNSGSGVLYYTDGYYYPNLFTRNSSSKNHSYGFQSDYGIFGTHDSGSANSAGLFYAVSG